MGVITIHFHDDFFDLYESEIVRVTDREIGNVNGEMSETDSFGIYYQTKHNGVAYQRIPVLGVTSWDYYPCPSCENYPCTSCEKVESHYKDDDPVFENLRNKLAVIAHNNEILRTIKNLT